MTGQDDVEKAFMIKIVYFDEQSASDYLDMSAGGRAAMTKEAVQNRVSEMHTKLEASVAAKFSWLPFLGASAEVGGGGSAGRASESILSKTLSNTILTDYLEQVEDDGRVRRLKDLQLTASKESMAYMKMYTPYMIAAKDNDETIDLARLDEALASAKGYYELIGQSRVTGDKCVLRFNLKAFRNSYGLTDLARMRLSYHGVLVGRTLESSLTMAAEMDPQQHDAAPTALDLVDGKAPEKENELDVFDVILAGVEFGD